MTKEIRIAPITNGTVIDHLNPGSAYTIIGVLKLREYTMTAGMNLDSKKMGKKDILFIDGKELSEKELNKVALIGRGATLNIIKDAEIKKKFELKYPDKAEGIIKCINPKCITNSESFPTKFSIKTNPLEATCNYCETTMNEEEIVTSVKK